MIEHNIEKDQQKCSVISVIGGANVGKSTLVNRLVGSKVSIVSPRVQTTRTLIRGIAQHQETQLILIDTPGMFQPKRRFEKALVGAIWRALEDYNILLFVVDVSHAVTESVLILLDVLKKQKNTCPVYLIFNKIDTIQKEALLELSKNFFQRFSFSEVFMISALSGKGVKDLERKLLHCSPISPWLFPQDDISDMPLRLLSSEIVREKCFELLYQEIPYGVIVNVERWLSNKQGEIILHQIIYVKCERHRQIVLGKNGTMIKKIGSWARKDLQTLLENTVHLYLYVKVDECWEENPDYYRQWGLEYAVDKKA